MAGGVVSFIESEGVRVYHGDCIEIMRTLPDASVDSVVTDPPYELGFMGKKWDDTGIAYNLDVWREALRVLKPGGHLLAFGGTRTWHRLAVAIEDAGFEVRDSIAWMYGSGFPKSLDVSKAIDRKRDDTQDIHNVVRWLEARRQDAGVTRAQVEQHFGTQNIGQALFTITSGSASRVATWDQWLELKSLLGFSDEMDAEVWRLNGRKGQPGEAWAEREVVGIQKNAMAGWSMDGTTQFVDRNITAPATPAAQQWQGWGTALKPAFEPIVVARKPLIGTVAENVLAHGTGALNIDGCRVGTQEMKRTTSNGEVLSDNGSMSGANYVRIDAGTATGRWPANVILDESQAAELDKQSGVSASSATSAKRPPRREGSGWDRPCNETHDAQMQAYGDSGGASRFFYCAKAPKKERPNVDGIAHPTVKPIALMRYLVRLVTPPGGTVLEPFAGSGTTVEACILEGFDCIAIEMTDDYLPLINERVRRSTEDKEGRLL
jgi:hypothetical protein